MSWLDDLFKLIGGVSSFILGDKPGPKVKAPMTDEEMGWKPPPDEDEEPIPADFKVAKKGKPS